MADVFISYHETSAGALAQQIADKLERKGITCWVAERDMDSGGNFADEIPSQIDACELFLLLLNEQACQSLNVANELALAFDRLDKRKDIKIFPLKMGEFQISGWVRYFLPLIQSVTFSARPDAQELNQLLKRIMKALNRKLTQSYPSAPQPSAPSQSKAVNPNECGENVTYALEGGELRISGSGPMRDYHGMKRPPWHSRRDEISAVRVEQGVTSIGKNALYGCANLTSVLIPDSVESIEDSAFQDCKNLERVEIPESVKFIGTFAFYGCVSLKSVLIPQNVKSIGRLAFSYCKSLKEVSIPESVNFIETAAFRYCDNLETVRIPDSVKYIEDYAFWGCKSLKRVRVPADADLGIKAFDYRYAKVTRRPAPRRKNP